MKSRQGLFISPYLVGDLRWCVCCTLVTATTNYEELTWFRCILTFSLLECDRIFHWTSTQWSRWNVMVCYTFVAIWLLGANHSNHIYHRIWLWNELVYEQNGTMMMVIIHIYPLCASSLGEASVSFAGFTVTSAATEENGLLHSQGNNYFRHKEMIVSVLII